MTVIRPSSISGINSITGNGGDISIFRADGTPADVTVNNITSGVITATHYGSGANLTNLPSGQLTGTIADARLSTVSSSKLSGALPALDGSALTGVGIGTDGSVNTSGIVTATAFVPTAGQLSHRNLIINGDFQVAQRADSSNNNGYTTVDRWKIESSNITHNSTKSRQNLSSSDTPYTLGFRRFARIALAQAGVVAATSYVEFHQKMEAQIVSNSGWNYNSTSSFITLQFWFRCSTNQTFYAWVTSTDGTNKRFTFSFTASGNNVWTKVTKTIPGASGIQIDNDTGEGFNVVIAPFYGTDYTGSMSLDTWVTKNDATHSPDYASTWLTAGASTFDITGVQLEVGPVATPFEHRSYGEELRRCYRYFQRRTSSDNYQWVSLVSFYAASEIHGFFDHYEPMRASPTLSADTGSNTLAVQRAGGYTTWTTGIVKNGGNLNVTYFYRDGVSLGTSGQCGRCLTWTAGCTITLSAEL